MINRIFIGMIGVAIVAAIINGKGAELAAAIPQGAQSGISLAISMAGPLCLWSGVSTVMDKIGLTDMLSRILRPALWRLFPSAKKDSALARSISGNICANLLGLGNAATPMGLRAAQLLTKDHTAIAGDELCRLIVLNTASIQLIPVSVAAIRSALGAKAPFDILPAVWLTSICAGFAGLLSAWLLGRLWKK